MICFVVLAIEILFLGVVTSFGPEEPDFLLASFLILMFSFFYAAYVSTSRKYKNVWRIMLAGYVFRIILLFWDLYGRSIYILPNGAMDSEGYWENSLRFLHGQEIRDYAMRVLGTLMKLCGSQRLFMQFFLLLSSVMTFHIILKIVKELELPEKIITLSVFLISFLPNYAIQSVMYQKEAGPVMFTAVSFLFFIRWYKCEGEYNFYYAMFFALAASLFHSATFTVAATYVFIRTFYDNKINKYKFTTKNIFIGLCLIAFALILFFSPLGDLLFFKIKGVKNINAIDSGVDWDKKGHTGYARYVGDSSSIKNIIIYTPLRIIFFLFSPLPFQVRGLSDILAIMFNSSFYMYTYYRAVIYILHKENKYRNLAIVFIIMGLMSAFVIGWGRPNVGTAIRHRDKMTACYIILLAISLSDNKYGLSEK